MMRFDRAHYERKLAALRAQREKDAGAVQEAEQRVLEATEDSALSVRFAEQHYTSAVANRNFDAEAVADAELAVKQAENALADAKATLRRATEYRAESQDRVARTHAALERARAANAEAAGPHQAYLDEARRRLEKVDRRIANHVATAPREATGVVCGYGYDDGSFCARGRDDGHTHAVDKNAMMKALDDEGGIGHLSGVPS